MRDGTHMHNPPPTTLSRPKPWRLHIRLHCATCEASNSSGCHSDRLDRPKWEGR